MSLGDVRGTPTFECQDSMRGELEILTVVEVLDGRTKEVVQEVRLEADRRYSGWIWGQNCSHRNRRESVAYGDLRKRNGVVIPSPGRGE